MVHQFEQKSRQCYRLAGGVVPIFSLGTDVGSDTHTGCVGRSLFDLPRATTEGWLADYPAGEAAIRLSALLSPARSSLVSASISASASA